MSTRELVDALVSGDSIAIENTFNASISDKITTALDSLRIKVAEKLFLKPEDSESSDVNSIEV